MTTHTKTKRLAVPALILSAAVALLSPTAAMAAPFNPDGSALYGPDTICQVTDAYDPNNPDTTATTCSPIPSVEWANSTIPTATPNWEGDHGYTRWSDPSFVSSFVNEGATVSSSESAVSFVVKPSDPASTPFFAEAALNTANNPVTVEAYFVADNTVIAKDPKGDIFVNEGLPGERSSVVTDGTAHPVTLTATKTGYTANVTVPTPTWVWKTGDMLNGFGYAGYLTTVVTAIDNSNGETVTVVERYAMSITSAYGIDITQFILPEPGGQIGVSVSGYDLIPALFPADEPVVVPPVVEPPVVNPPVVEPPVVEPPVVEPPVGPKVNSGADFSTDPTVWLPIGLASIILVAMFGALAVVRKRELGAAE